MAAFRSAAVAVSRLTAAGSVTASAAAPACLRRGLQACAAVASAKAPGPVEQKLREEVAAFKPPAGLDVSTLAAGPDGKRQYSAKIKKLADELVGLTLLEAMDLTEVMKAKLHYSDRYGIVWLLVVGAWGVGGQGAAR